MQNVIVHLIGNPGVGKYTIAQLVAQRLGARLVDNHSIANVIFNVIAPDGVTPLPPEIWPRVHQVRAAVLDTITNVAPPGISYVFTNYLRGGSPAEYAVFEEMQGLAERRAALFIPVVLTCATAALQERITGEDRQARLKLIDPVLGAHFNDGFPAFESHHPNELRLDTTTRTPAESAAAIMEWLEALAAPSGGVPPAHA